MAIKKYNPTSAGRRAGSVIHYKGVLTKFEPEKSLTVGRIRANGRNHHGVITAKHRGGGNKKLYRLIDFKRTKDGVPARVEAIEYDPNRTTFIALIKYSDGDKAYILCPNGLRVGTTVVSGVDAPPEIGNAMPLANVPAGLEIHPKAMNPIDHPLGGGEGRSNGGRHPVSKTGVPAKGGITRHPKKHSEKLILRRRKFGTHQQRPQTVSL